MTNSKIWVFALYLQSLSREESLCHIGDMFYNFLCILIKRMPHLVAMYQRQGMLKTYMFLNLGPHRTKIIPWFVFKYIHKHKCHQYYIHSMMFSQEIHISIGQWPREIWFSVCEYIFLCECIFLFSGFWLATTMCDSTYHHICSTLMCYSIYKYWWLINILDAS